MAITIPELESADLGALSTAAGRLGEATEALGRQADSARQTLVRLKSSWEGTASDAASRQGQQFANRAQGLQEHLRGLQNLLHEGGNGLAAVRSGILQTVSQLKGQGWQVAPDGTVSVAPGSALDQVSRNSPVSRQTLQAQGASESSRLKTQLAQFTAQDETLAQRVREGIFGEDVPGTDPQAPSADPGPGIDGPATYPQMEGDNSGQQDDLDCTIPGTGIALGGDGKYDYPHINVPGVYEGRNPLPVPPGSRPLPTGTALGPNGQHYAFYAVVPYNSPGYTSPDTVVVDLAHPSVPIATLHGIAQASGAYDATTGRMVVMGNSPDGHRALWQSAPVGQNSNWTSTLQSAGTFSGKLDGNRESQIVALPNGRGLMVVGAADSKPIVGAAAGSVQGLLNPKLPVTDLVPQLKDNQFPYGPTVTDIREVDGKDVVTLRTSTFGIGGYDPHTYSSTYTVTP